MAELTAWSVAWPASAPYLDYRQPRLSKREDGVMKEVIEK